MLQRPILSVLIVAAALISCTLSGLRSDDADATHCEQLDNIVEVRASIADAEKELFRIGHPVKWQSRDEREWCTTIGTSSGPAFVLCSPGALEYLSRELVRP